jgi:hypothetical protein
VIVVDQRSSFWQDGFGFNNTTEGETAMSYLDDFRAMIQRGDFRDAATLATQCSEINTTLRAQSALHHTVELAKGLAIKLAEKECWEAARRLAEACIEASSFLGAGLGLSHTAQINAAQEKLEVEIERLQSILDK